MDLRRRLRKFLLLEMCGSSLLLNFRLILSALAGCVGRLGRVSAWTLLVALRARNRPNALTDLTGATLHLCFLGWEWCRMGRKWIGSNPGNGLRICCFINIDSNMELQRGTLIYYNSNTFISVYQGLLGSTPVAIKELCFNTIDAANSALREAMIQAQLDHPHICRVYDCRLEEYQGWVKVVLVLEWLEGGDVWKEIERRVADRQGWTAEELERHAKAMVDALAYAQTRGISHRDVKPQNIYLTGDKSTLKLGDFGSSKRSFSPELTSTLHGTPAFLSPELRKQLVSVLMNGGESLRHDESKADVYSLGITLICMALLRYPQEEIGAGEAVLCQLVERLGLSKLVTTAIKQMLSTDVVMRPTFEELSRLLNQPKPDVNLGRCVQCNLSLQRSGLVCSSTILLSCEHLMHESCCYTYLEDSFQCQGELQAKCPECKQELSLEGLRASEQWQQLLNRVQHKCVYCRETTLKGAQGPCEHWLCLNCWSKSSECVKCQEYEKLMYCSSG